MARSTYSPRNLSHQIEKEKYQKESEIENSETVPSCVPAVRNKAPCYYANLLEQKKVFT